MSKIKMLAFLSVPTLGLFTWLMYLVIQIASMQNVTLRISGYDPRDLIFGQYILYHIDWDNSDCAQFDNNVCPKKDFENLSRYYVSEDYSGKIDKRLKFSETGDIFEIVYRYKQGKRPTARQLLINHQPWQKFFIEREKLK